MLWRVLCLIGCLTFLSAFLSENGFAQNVPQFRGAGGMGVVKDAKISDQWDKAKNLQWKVEVEGAGWSQPVIWKDRIYLTTAVAANGFKPKDFAGGARNPASMGMGSKRPNYKVEWKVVCLDAKTGEQVWSTSVAAAQPKFGIHPSNSYATETPAVDEKGVYAYFGSAGVVVGLDHQGNKTWNRDLGVFKTNNDFGTGSSLAINEGRIFVQALSEESADIHCLKTSNGETIWKNERDKSHKTSWSTPLVWTNTKRTELIVSGGMQIDSYDPATGEQLWKVTKVKSATACSVFGDEKHIYFGGSDPMSKGPLFAIGAGGSGEIQPKLTNQTFENCAWRVPRSGPGMSTPVSNGEYVLMTDRSVVKLLKAEDGSEVFKERLPGLSMVVGCATVVGDEVLLVDERGNMGAVKLQSKFEFRSLGSVEDTVWSTPAVTKDSLFVRGVNALYKFKL